MLTVKAAVLIFICGRGSAITSAKEGKSGSIYNLMNSQLVVWAAQMCVHSIKTLTVTHRAHIYKPLKCILTRSRNTVLSSTEIFEAS